MLLRFLSSGLLTLGLVQCTLAQEPNSKPDTPTPNTIQPSISVWRKSSTVRPSDKPTEPETVEDLAALAGSIAEYAVVAGCQPNTCTVLVANFTTPDGNTSAYGMRLADKLASELARREYRLQVIDRSLLQNLLAKDRIPAKSINHGVIRSIAAALDPRFMIFGITEKFDNNVVRLSSQLIDMTSKDWSGYNAIVNFGPLKSGDNLAASEPFAPLPEITSSASGETVYRAGVDGVTSPSCPYMPSPHSAEGARKLNMSGSVVVEAVVSSHGELENKRIVRGMPGGLNEQTIATMRTWRCNPARKDDKPVSTLLQFIIDFRFY